MLSLYLFLAAQQSTLACKKLGIIFTFTPGHKKSEVCCWWVVVVIFSRRVISSFLAITLFLPTTLPHSFNFLSKEMVATLSTYQKDQCYMQDVWKLGHAILETLQSKLSTEYLVFATYSKGQLGNGVLIWYNSFFWKNPYNLCGFRKQYGLASVTSSIFCSSQNIGHCCIVDNGMV